MSELQEAFTVETFDAARVLELLEEYGVAVVTCGIDKEQAKKWHEELLDWMKTLNPAFKSKRAWQDEKNYPYGPRLGMMQSLLSHAAPVWSIREAFYPWFTELHGDTNLITSIDGGTIHPNVNDRKPQLTDWPHLDQTNTEVLSIQGQLVLSTTTASFRCTPGSHKYMKSILEICSRPENYTSDFLKFNQDQTTKVKNLLQQHGLVWQMPVKVPAGALIFWRSCTIHSAQRQENRDQSWRSVVYVCMRPMSQLTNEEKEKLREAAMQGCTTNHSATKIFPRRVGPRALKHQRAQVIENATDKPHRYTMSPDVHTVLIKKLTAQTPWGQ